MHSCVNCSWVIAGYHQQFPSLNCVGGGVMFNTQTTVCSLIWMNMIVLPPLGAACIWYLYFIQYIQIADAYIWNIFNILQEDDLLCIQSVMYVVALCSFPNGHRGGKRITDPAGDWKILPGKCRGPGYQGNFFKKKISNILLSLTHLNVECEFLNITMPVFI